MPAGGNGYGKMLYLDGGIGRLVHGGHARAVELAGEALDVALQRHRAHARLEVEQTLQSYNECKLQ